MDSHFRFPNLSLPHWMRSGARCNFLEIHWFYIFNCHHIQFSFLAGKSSLVPQYLLEENMDPILCTQPRRFAVVAIARAIAESRNWQLGEEVGYHIGHSNVSDLNSKRYFTLLCVT